MAEDGLRAFFDSNFWSALFGALVAGLISYVLQVRQQENERSRRRAERRAQEALELERELDTRAAIADSLLMKMSKIHSNVNESFDYLHDGLARGIKTRMGMFGATHAFSTDMRIIHFTDEEFSLVRKVGGSELFNAFISIAEINRLYVENFALYRTIRLRLHDLVSVVSLDVRGVGATEFHGADAAKARLTEREGRHILLNLYARTWSDLQTVTNVFYDLQAALLANLGKGRMGLSWNVTRMNSRLYPRAKHVPEPEHRAGTRA